MNLLQQYLRSHLVVPLLAALSVTAATFVPNTNPTSARRCWRVVAPSTMARPEQHFDGSLIGPTPSTMSTSAETDTATTTASIRAPLKYKGPYRFPCLSLRFPSLATPAQRTRNATGISLDFILDTAATSNAINLQVAKELGLDVVGPAPPGYSANGAIGGGLKFLLGDCQLEGVAPSPDVLKRNETTFTFMTGLTASALPVVLLNDVAGLLGLTFFNNFPGGVEFSWEGEAPYVAFHAQRPPATDLLGKGVKIRQLPGTMLPLVTLRVNGVEIPALLDTGAPFTVLNFVAARLAGVETVERDYGEKNGGGMNPFVRIAKGFKTAQAAFHEDVLAIVGSRGERVELIRSNDEVDIGVGDDTNTFGRIRIFVGDLPVLAAFGTLGHLPMAFLGLDVLRLRSKMFYTPNEVYF